MSIFLVPRKFYMDQCVLGHNDMEVIILTGMPEKNEIVYTYTSIRKYKKRLLIRCIHHYKSDLINNMDHMRISGTEHS